MPARIPRGLERAHVVRLAGEAEAVDGTLPVRVEGGRDGAALLELGCCCRGRRAGTSSLGLGSTELVVVQSQPSPGAQWLVKAGDPGSTWPRVSLGWSTGHLLS